MPQSVLTAAQEREQAIRAEGVRLHYESMPNSYIGSAVMASVLAAILHQSMSPALWGPWLAAMYLQAAGRWLLHSRFLRAAPPQQAMARWGRFAVAGSLISGCIWGAGAVLGFVYTQGIMQLIWTPMIIMLGAVATFAAVSYLPAFYAFFFPAALPGIAMFLAQSDQLRFLVGVAFLCYLPLVTRFAHVLHRSFLTSMQLRFDNMALVNALQVEKSAAEEANLAKSRFLAAASHDLRQPMHAMSLFIASLSQSPLPQRESGLVNNLRLSADAMESLFDALLDISRLDAGAVEQHPAHFQLRPVVERLAAEFAPQAQARGLTLRLRVRDVAVHTDPMLLNRILSNLISNAIRYGAREGVLLALRLRAGRVAIEVWDTGVGIAEHERAGIFREFYQVGNPERDRGKGLGLGLAIVDRLVRLLGLSLQMRSTVGRGSLFRVLVPLGDRRAIYEAASDLKGIQPAPLSGLLVWVIDDEQAVCEAMAALLTQWGCRVITASGSEQINELLNREQQAPRLIICDYRLRGADNGIDVIESLRANYNDDIPSLIVTGDTLPERLAEARRSGLPVLHKPVNAGKLRAMINSLTAARSLLP